MPSQTRADLRSQVRLALDMDDEELTDATLDLYLNDGLEQTLAASENWPFLEQTWTFPTVSGQVEYTLATDLTPSDVVLDSVVNLVDASTGNMLTHVAHDRAERMFGEGTTTGVPAFWSDWGGQIHIWPAPDSVRTIRLRGFRRSSWGAAATDVPDVDTRLHVPLMYWAISRAYAAQEDDVLEVTNKNHWMETVLRAQASVEAAPSRKPLILSGDRSNNNITQVRLTP